MVKISGVLVVSLFLCGMGFGVNHQPPTVLGFFVWIAFFSGVNYQPFVDCIGCY